MKSSVDSPPRGETVRLGGLDVHFHDHRPVREQAGVVVFVHGSGPGASGYSNFKLNTAAFVDAGFRVVVPDLPGFGYSSKPTDIDYTTDFFVEHVIGLLDALGVGRCALIGNSLGGAVCIRAALDHPARFDKLVVMAPGGLEDMPTYLAMPAMAHMIDNFVGGKLDREGLRGVLETLVFDTAHVTEALLDERYAILQTQPPQVLARMRVPNMESELAGIACPVLAFWGADDELVPASGGRKILRACRPSRLIEVAGCGHWVMVEYWRLFNTACLDFLEND